MRFIFIFLTLISLCLSANSTLKYLETSDKAELYAQELLDEIRNKEALEFVDQARLKYTNNAKILIYGGDAAYGLDMIELSQQYYQAAINIASEDAIEAIVQDHIEGGYVKEAALLLVDARGVYPNNADLLVFSGRAAYELSDLASAKNYYLLALEIDANNEIAAANIANIEAQEEAQENKAISGTLAYLTDKGLDFLMIFLAFLGGELLAKRYLVCESKNVINSINSYMKKKYKQQYTSQRILFYKPFCAFAMLLNFLTIAATLLIIWVFVNITIELPIPGVHIDLTVMTEHDIFSFAIYSYILILLFILAIHLLLVIIKERRSEDEQFMDAVENLQHVALEGQFIVLYKACRLIAKHKESEKEINRILNRCYSDEAKTVIRLAFDDVISNEKM